MSESTATHQPAWVPLDFRKAVVSSGEQPGTLVLTVTGDTPRNSLRGAAVKLKPLTYESQPEYWKIEVLWDATNATVPIVTPFIVSLAVDQFRGTKGIEVVGQSRSQKISI